MVGLVVLAFVAGASSTSVCGEGSGHVQKRVEDAAPALTKGRFQKIFRGLKALDPESSLDVDERHVRLTLMGDKAPAAVRLPLALPAPWSGFVDVTPRPPADGKDARFCAVTEVVLFDKDLKSAAVDNALPVELAVTFAKKGSPARSMIVKHDGLVFSTDVLTARVGDSDEMRLYIGDGPPSDDLLEQDGADLYMKSLAMLDPAIVEDIRQHPSPQAQRVLFAEVAAGLRTGLAGVTPERRISEIARFDEKAMPPELRPLLHFWKTELGPRTARADASVHMIVDEAVISLWVDGAEVFNRKKGTPTGFDLKVPAEAVRAWIVTMEPGVIPERPVVHDTRAVLKAGEIYSVTSTFVQTVKGGSRRECVRVVGHLPADKDIRWREISGTHTPMLGDDETYRPSAPSAERAISVVPGGDARPFPPVPLIYSYTHPGLYKWSLDKEGAAHLELVDDPTVCQPSAAKH